MPQNDLLGSFTSSDVEDVGSQHMIYAAVLCKRFA